MEIPQKTSPSDDLAFLRALAEAGRDVPLTCGPYFLAAGLVFGAASFVAWGISQAPTHFAATAIQLVWMIAGLSYVPIVWVLNRRADVVAGSTATINRAVSTIWTGLSWGIATMFVCSMILCWRYDSPMIWAAFPSTMLALYGAGWGATAFISRQGWLKLVTAGSFLAAIAVAAATGSSYTFLIYGVLLVVLIAIPGWVLIQRRTQTA